MDNPDPGVVVAPGNPDPAAPITFSWKKELAADFAGSPTFAKFPDTKEGLNEAVKSHLSLERLLGHEKVPVPKGPDDPARAIFNKALGIPEKPDGYALPDAVVPDAMKGLTFDKVKFAETVHKYDLTPGAAKGLWEAYTEMTKQSYTNALKAQQEKVTGIVNEMRKEWGDAYQSKVELGQMVINKFSADKEMNDFITATLSADPRGIKFLATLGDQFAENKIGDFKYQRHSLTPEEAQREIDSIKSDPKHPYLNPQAPKAEHDRAVEHVNTLIAVTKRARG